MPLIPTADLIADASQREAGVCAFNVIHLETARALADAAAETGIPLILQISQNCVQYHGGLEPIAAATLAVAQAAPVGLAVHLDHAEDEDLVRQAIALGFGSVMFDGSRLPFDQNVAATRRMAQAAHDAGVWLEAELGEIGGKDGAHAPGVRTDPDEARQFVAATHADGLAVAVGSSHAMRERSARLDLDLVARLDAAVDVPLVLHGSSGVPDDVLVAAVAAGIRKVNISTHLNGHFTRAVRAYLTAEPEVVDSRRYFRPATDAVQREAARLLQLIDEPLKEKTA